MTMFKKIAGLALTIGLVAAPAMAVDYGSMSTEELAAMRGTLQNATVEERQAFQQEWRNRIQNMTPEERQQYVGQGRFGQGQGRGLRQGVNGGQQGAQQGKAQYQRQRQFKTKNQGASQRLQNQRQYRYQNRVGGGKSSQNGAGLSRSWGYSNKLGNSSGAVRPGFGRNRGHAGRR